MFCWNQDMEFIFPNGPSPLWQAPWHVREAETLLATPKGARGSHLCTSRNIAHLRGAWGTVILYWENAQLGISSGSENWCFPVLHKHHPISINHRCHFFHPETVVAHAFEAHQALCINTSFQKDLEARHPHSPESLSYVPVSPLCISAVPWPWGGRQEGGCLINFPLISQFLHYWHLHSTITDIKSFTKQNVINEKSIRVFKSLLWRQLWLWRALSEELSVCRKCWISEQGCVVCGGKATSRQGVEPFLGCVELHWPMNTTFLSPRRGKTFLCTW